MPFYYVVRTYTFSLESVKNLAAFYRRLENNLEIASTPRGTGKPPLINYVIGNNKKIKIFEKKQELLACTGTSQLVNHCDVIRGCELQIY